MSLRAIGLAGSLFAPSRSGLLVEAALAELSRQGMETSYLDLSKISADALLARAKAPEMDEALAQVTGVPILIVGTPVYRATYTGQLKTFFDLLPMNALAGTVAGLIATGAGPNHALAVDHGLRPLIASLQGVSAGKSIYATDSAFPEGGKGAVPEALLESVREMVSEVVRLASSR